ncbi:hypothetical protein ASPZODRAFT_133061 [Penicilliopsis zonata CBS 506.65]|uniref:C2H2-type domain-containing protein n=1 Tax=Penicilliopsis zonata CBS 506.65 TaxID=1073090 RepID=A0A1L9SFR1_9EURO|nr:hypothetical protein ASPZODRAFT_133061 [Penicilliopsis zonata CBS 506.65]OJJ46080.1 hypothetical protein ASPZODRAFT_133061 [Penicilliopsis zonata CBS 506.65]
MLAIESSRHRQLPYFQPSAMDATLVDPLAMDALDAYAFYADAGVDLHEPHVDFPPTPPLMAASSSSSSSSSQQAAAAAAAATAFHAAEQFISSLSSASAPSIASASSSAMGSPHSSSFHAFPEHWVDTNHGLGLQDAMMGDLFAGEYMGNGSANPHANMLDVESGFYPEKYQDSYGDPSLIQPVPRHANLSPPTISYPDQSGYLMMQSEFFHLSPVGSPLPMAEYPPPVWENPLSHQPAGFVPPPVSPSPLLVSEVNSRPASIYERRSSISSTHSSHHSHPSPGTSSLDLDEDSREKGRCPYPECGRVFKDLKAHMLTHMSERPEKCPIVTCEYHIKGFARKYDKNRHTLTHYKGTMVCGFCPGSGSPAEKSFNRADVFKRHLFSVHSVEQTPPNGRKRSSTVVSTSGSSSSSNGGGSSINNNNGNGNKESPADYCNDVTGKCSTCSATFTNAQDFYEHLDDCVLRVVQQEEPSEAINQQRLAEVAADEDVKKTMEKHQLSCDTAGPVEQQQQQQQQQLFDDDTNDMDDDDDANELPSSQKWRSGRGSLKSTKNTNGAGASNGVNKQRGAGGASKRRNNRDNYPQSWGCPTSSMKTKKRVLCVFNGQRRLWKDEMMLDNEYEVRIKLPGGAGDGTGREAYVTDLDVETLKRAEGVHSASADERGPWDGHSVGLMGQPAMVLPHLGQQEDEVNLDELMA